jgi:hypothetical protein
MSMQTRSSTEQAQGAHMSNPLATKATPTTCADAVSCPRGPSHPLHAQQPPSAETAGQVRAVPEASPPKPADWDRMCATDLEAEWLILDRWVHWLRRTYGLPATVIPPLWHRHPELVWELSALHFQWVGAYRGAPMHSAPLGWHRDFAETIQRLRAWTSTCGSRLDSDRPTRQTRWPGEDPQEDDKVERAIIDRARDFDDHVTDQVVRRLADERQPEPNSS